MRLTNLRQLVLDSFKGDNSLLCAEDIRHILREEAIDLSTIYRALEYLNSKDFLGKSTINKTSYFYLLDGEHHHYMICTKCLARFPIECELNRLLKKSVKEHKFHVTDHDLTVYGYCVDCGKQKRSKKSHCA